MRHDPLFLRWTVHCPTPEEAASLQHWLRTEVSADTTLADEVHLRKSGFAREPSDPFAFSVI
jgi:hypothetical protein